MASQLVIVRAHTDSKQVDSKARATRGVGACIDPCAVCAVAAAGLALVMGLGTGAMCTVGLCSGLSS